MAQDGHMRDALVSELRATIALMRAALDRQDTEANAVLREAVAALKDQLAEKDRQLAELRGLLLAMTSRQAEKPKGLIPRLRVLLFGPDGQRAA